MKDIIKKKSVVASNGCWLWKGIPSWDGYCQLQYNWRRMQAHVAAYIAWYGEVPPGLIVMHTCDVRNCVNPEHLRLGTYKSNMEDAVHKGRMATKEKNGNAKLNNEKVAEIKRLRNEGLSQPKIARIIGCSNQTVSNVVNNKYW
jgi:DNA-binding XRE family transcriptional regulator